MEHGPDPSCPEQPPLPEDLRTKIPRSTLSYWLTRFLKLEWSLTRKKGVFMKGQARHLRIRKFVIEMHRALKLEANDDYVICFTDETYIHQNHSPVYSWHAVDGAHSTEKTTSKGKRLIILHAITRDGFIATIDPATGKPITENALTGDRSSQPTAEWIWPAKSNLKDYHTNKDAAGFDWWLHNRLIPGFEATFPNKKMILVMDNASYHKQQSTEFYPEGKGPATASKGLNAHVLRKAGCTQIEIKRGEATLAFSVPVEEPANFAQHREHGGRSPSCDGLDGTVYARSPKGPSSEELALATSAYLKAYCPQALESRVERLFAEKDWKIIWTPPYCPKFQPIELVWGGGKQRAAQLYRPGRNLQRTRDDLRIGFYGGQGHGSNVFQSINIAGCWLKALGEINAWISKDIEHEEDGLTGDLVNLVGVQKWTSTQEDCLDCKDIVEGGDSTEDVNEGDLHGACDLDSDGDSESDGANN
jgi:transposase